MTNTAKPHYAYIECVRGYAVLLVILAHATYVFPGLPYPVHRLTVMGWYGVQLFFLASAVTLMMSWHHEMAQHGAVDVRAFFLRRFFRIAPAYYAAAVLYFSLTPPPGGFDLLQALASFLFVNAWHPVLMSTTPGGWSVVPGGWSIGVEFTFYIAFPLIAALVTSLPRSLCLVFGTLLAGGVLNSLVRPFLATVYDPGTAGRFLYFWFPNQMSVFALGISLFFLLQYDRGSRSWFAAQPTLLAALSILLGLGVSLITRSQPLTLQLVPPPEFLIVSIAFMIFILALARAGPGWFINPVMSLLGRISFSAYLLHFAVLNVVAGMPVMQPYVGLTGWPAIIAFPIAMAGIVAVVVAASWCSYRVIEMPMIGIGKMLIRDRRLVSQPVS